ncbi:ECF transporter S component [Mycoplasma phocoeninasale]|uniref:ECF transporter S component n=1 Tax=Mycoplasma phocoeninasale TaxID=2726117 RepID=A0A858U370_9MOLU|nr:ECF transporter S component [Mycoplasma phocoeninasale]QJG66421.1 ECF transporter S component [Mycoplasma phocoeninasale]
MISLFQNIRRNFKTKAYKFSVYEIALFGLLLAIYIIAALVEKYVFIRNLRVTITYAIYVVFGLALGPWRAAFLGLLCDTMKSVIDGIGFWTIEYAIVPVVIAFASGWFIRAFFFKNRNTWISGFLFLIMLTILFVAIAWAYWAQTPPNKYSASRRRIFPPPLVLAVGLLILSLIWITSIIVYYKSLKSRNFKFKYNTALFFQVLLVVTFVYILFRWLWGPFAFINYYNRFRSGNWSYQDYYFPVMVPIMFKSLIAIPIYTAVIFAVHPVIIMIRKRIYFYTHHSYNRSENISENKISI